jgi:hypothetical protein
MRLVTRACLTQKQQPPENFARVNYFLIQDSPGYQGMLDTGTATQTSRGRVGCHIAFFYISDIFFQDAHTTYGIPVVFQGCFWGGTYLCQTLGSVLKRHFFYGNRGVALWELILDGIAHQPPW